MNTRTLLRIVCVTIMGLMATQNAHAQGGGGQEMKSKQERGDRRLSGGDGKGERDLKDSVSPGAAKEGQQGTTQGEQGQPPKAVKSVKLPPEKSKEVKLPPEKSKTVKLLAKKGKKMKLHGKGKSTTLLSQSTQTAPKKHQNTKGLATQAFQGQSTKTGKSGYATQAYQGQSTGKGKIATQATQYQMPNSGGGVANNNKPATLAAHPSSSYKPTLAVHPSSSYKPELTVHPSSSNKPGKP